MGDNITERMKKYAEPAKGEPWEFKACREHKEMLSDLQAAMRVLEVAAEALFGLRYSHGCWCDRPVKGGELHSRCCKATDKALNKINKILGEK